MLRSIVAKEQRKLKNNEGLQMDITYITEKILAMSFPGEGVSSMWRNHIEDVAKFLNENHKDHYLIFNLSESYYNHDYFGGVI
jgi:phosphatidylinositol-3,4,5-trisphosphate 3-phosphatase/dual-specificity protein phosphatase PTEN